MAKNTALAAYKAGLKAKKSGSRKKPGMTISVAVVAGFVPAVIGVYNRRSSMTAIGDYLRSSFTGFDSAGNFNFSNLKSGLLPVAGGVIVHKIAGKLGINKAIARSGIPFIRI